MPHSPRSLRPLYWMGSSLKELRDSPEEVKDGIGYALELVQKGERPANAKPLKGFGGASVLEIVEDFDGDTWRAVYTVAVANAVYVLPKKELDLIKRRLRDAIEHGKAGMI